MLSCWLQLQECCGLVSLKSNDEQQINANSILHVTSVNVWRFAHVSMYPSGWTQPLCHQACSMETALLHGNELKKSTVMSQLQDRKKDLCTLSEATDWLNFLGVTSTNQFGYKQTWLKIASLSEELMRYRYLNLPVFFRWCHKGF